MPQILHHPRPENRLKRQKLRDLIRLALDRAAHPKRQRPTVSAVFQRTHIDLQAPPASSELKSETEDLDVPSDDHRHRSNRPTRKRNIHAGDDSSAYNQVGALK